MDDVLVVLATVPDAEVGAALSRLLVEERLAACVNRLPGVRSTYLWEGKLHEDAEELLVMKTTASSVDALRERFLEAHPYECPEFLELPVSGGAEAYLGWVRAGVREG